MQYIKILYRYPNAMILFFGNANYSSAVRTARELSTPHPALSFPKSTSFFPKSTSLAPLTRYISNRAFDKKIENKKNNLEYRCILTSSCHSPYDKKKHFLKPEKRGVVEEAIL